ncbi:MAG: lamin tail domain-containing protein [Rhodothermales bacterium]
MPHLMLLLILLLAGAPPAAVPSWRETFADGDLRRDPAWTGDTTRWMLAPAGADWMLLSAGPEASDTLALETASTAAYGAWTISAGYAGGPLSNFNLSRIYLMAEAGGALDEASSYFIQIGSNDHDVRLYRAASGIRTLLGQSAPDYLDGDTARLALRVERRRGAGWQVFDGGVLLFEAPDAGDVPAARFGLWVKHTRARGGDFFFDDIAVEGDAGPPPPPALEPGALVINEIHFAPTPSAGEFVELYNRSARPINLRGLTLADDRDEPALIALNDLWIEPDAYRVLVRDSVVFRDRYPGVPAVTMPDWPSLNNDADVVTLYAGATPIDAVAYEAGWGLPGVSLERRDPGGPAWLPGNWGASVDPDGATPGRRNSRFEPDRTAPALLLAEWDAEEQVTTYWSEPVAVASVSSDRFRIGPASPQRLAFIGPDVIRLVFTGPPAGDRLRVSRVTDLTGNDTGDLDAPLARAPAPGELALNEILYEPRADPFDNRADQPEYAEIVNRSSDWLSLRRIELAGPEDEQGAADTLRHEAPPTALAPGALAIWYAGREGDLAGAFPSLPAPHLAPRLSVDAATLGFGNSGDTIRLLADGALIDAVTYRPDWHYPLLAETRGIALERRWRDAPNDLAASWSSSVDPEGGTPGRPNSIAQEQASGSPPAEGLTVAPSPFSPDGDGHDDAALLRVASLEAPAVVRARIFDSEGNAVRRLDTARLAGFDTTLAWDGRDDAGEVVRIGLYIALVDVFYADRRAGRTYKAPVIVARPLGK